MQFPAIILKGNGNYQIVRYPTAVIYGEGEEAVCHPLDAWNLWSNADWEAACPGWRVLPLLENPQPAYDEIAQINPFAEWNITAVGVEVTYTYTAMGAQELAAKDMQLMQSVQMRVQDYLDVCPRDRNYTNMLSACSYATSTNAKYAAEGQYCVDYRDRVWEKYFQLLAEVQAGTRDRMTPDQVIAELPAFEWPAV
jgi:hypothetical protein